VTKHEEFAALPSFVGRRGLLVEAGPTIVGCTVVEVSCDADQMQARISCDDGHESSFGGRWDSFVFDADFWQVLYANARIVFDALAVGCFDAGELFDIEDYL
jgi:hypothetical protein